MGKSKIEWCDRTWNPVTGCTKISPGCANCYAERMSKRLAGRCGYPTLDPFKVTAHSERLGEPARWRKPSRVFVCSMGDLFHDDVPNSFIWEVFMQMRSTEIHTFLILTKRPERMKFIISWLRDRGMWPLNHVWLGVTCENQEQANKRIPVLLQIPAAVRFVSVEPMLSPVDISLWFVSGYMEPPYDDVLNWVICGGESGPGARPLHPDWVRSLRDQCQVAGASFLFKQWGEWEAFYDRDRDDPDWRNVPEEGPRITRINLAGGKGFHGDRVVYFCRVNKKKAGRLLDGRTWDEYPEVVT